MEERLCGQRLWVTHTVPVNCMSIWSLNVNIILHLQSIILIITFWPCKAMEGSQCTFICTAGLYFYGLYLRRNYDGSQSESITQLAADIPTGEGREINLQPETNMHIKVRLALKAWELYAKPAGDVVLSCRHSTLLSNLCPHSNLKRP